MPGTTISKAIDAAKGQHPEHGDRGLYDSAAKGLISTRYILAWIVKTCVQGAHGLSVKSIAAECIEPDISVSKTPVYREDAEAEDPGKARLELTEDASVTEGVVRYDILFKLRLPGEKEPIVVIINVELQNRSQLPYPIAARGWSYAARLLGQQGPEYENLHKVYSIWVVSNPPQGEENRIISYSIARKDGNGPLAAPEKEADLMEVIFLNLGDPDAVMNPDQPGILWLLDVLFSKALSTADKKSVLETNFDIPMTKAMEGDMVTMQDTRFGFEVEAEQKGKRETLYRLVKNGKISLADAAEDAGVSIQQFEHDMQEMSPATLS